MSDNLNLIVVDKSNQEQTESFMNGLNQAYLARSNKKIPFCKKTLNDLGLENKILYSVISADNKIIGGFTATKIIYDSLQTIRINNVWVHPKFFGGGVATYMLSAYLGAVTSNNAQIIQLDVTNIYEPAVRLYKKLGFKTISICANEPGTYYFISMIRDVPPYHYPFMCRMARLIISKIKFTMLFKKDSTPKLLHKIIFKQF